MPYYSKEQIAAAQQVDLVAYLQSRCPGEIVWDKARQRWQRADSGSIEVFTPQRREKNLSKYPTISWYDFGAGSGGDTIRYLTEFHGRSFTDAVGELLDFCGLRPAEAPLRNSIDIFFDEEKEGIHRAPAGSTAAAGSRAGERAADHHAPQGASAAPHTAPAGNTPPNAAPSAPPERRDEHLQTVIGYLTGTRHISANLVSECVNRRILYADARRNCVFFNPQRGGYYIIRGTHDAGYSFKQSKSGADFWEYVTTEPVKKVYVCEAPIDALSLCQLLAKPKNCAFTAMGGLKPQTYAAIAAAYPKAKLLCAVDWDAGGDKFFSRLGAGKRLKPQPDYRKTAKDWNELLVQMLKNDPQ